MSTAIEFNNVSKQYKLGLVSTKTLSHDLNRWWQTKILGKEDPYLKIGSVNDRSAKADSDYVWALKDIDFKVEQGDVVGIIGKNGAGKSTLLKLLSRVTNPTTGTIRARGRIASLLEVGTGFHPELTGRENIYMNGSIMGMNKAEITRKLDEIVAFSGCERYIDTPVKRYSSGMTVRLGFAIAAHLDPEILVVDEVLAVGDAEFQKKAIGKMQDVSKGEGRTVLFVSHNMASVRKLCKSGIILKNGSIEMVGTALECVENYIGSNIEKLEDNVQINKRHRAEWQQNVLLELEYLNVRMLNDVSSIATDEILVYELTLKRNVKTVNKCQVGFLFADEEDRRVGTFTSELFDVPDKEIFKVKVSLKNHNLGKGKYSMTFNVGLKDLENGSRDYDVVKDVIRFEVLYQYYDIKKEYLLWSKDWGNSCYDYRNSLIEIL